MPLKHGSGRSTISRNISELHSGEQYAKTRKKFGKRKANKQAVAIALSEARKSRHSKNVGERYSNKFY